MRLKEITLAEYNRLCGDNGKTYFSNGCIFDEETDNLIAFCWYKDAKSEASKYYKVVGEFDIPHSEAEQELNLYHNLRDLGIM